MKPTIVVFFLVISVSCFPQYWSATYSDSAIYQFPDSLRSKLASGMKEKEFPDKLMAAAMRRVTSGPLSRTRTRNVYATSDSTEIELIVAEKGSLRIDVFATQYFLLKRNELYVKTNPYSYSYDSIISSPPKQFRPTGRQPFYFGYKCKEYISTDSSCTIWVTSQLRSCINPGIRTGKIMGAVLFYELRSGNDILVRCRITKLKKTKWKYS